MNNAVFQEENEPTESTEIQIALLTRQIEAVAGLLENKDWRTLQELCFSKEIERIDRLLLQEAKKTDMNFGAMLTLQGELKWAKRYSDLASWAKLLKNQLDNLKHG